LRKEPYYTTQKYAFAFQRGEEKGFVYFFNAYHKALCLFANRYVKDMAGAEDIVEESFIKVWEKREQIETEEGFRNYLYKTVYHGCLRWLENNQRTAKHLNNYNSISPENERNFFENIVYAETLRQLHEAIQQLPIQCRKVCIKLYIEGKTVSQTATELEVTASTIRNQKARGIKLLKLKLGGWLLVASYWFLIVC
jgi:RNA polymerase sigma-70 factor (family 1)